MSTEHDNGGGDRIDRDLVGRYRKASAALDERPSATARAAILAAAAREVQAKPMAAGSAHRRRPSWPLAAAAVVMLSTLAVTLAIRTHEEMPQFSTTDTISSSAAEKVAASPPALAPPSEASRVAEDGARSKQSVPAQQAAPAHELDRNTENRQSASHDAPLNSLKRRESDQAATAPLERKQKAPPAPNAPAVNVGPAATPPANVAPPAAPSLPKTQSADAAPPAAEAPIAAGSALKKAQGEVSAGLGASARDQAASSAPDARADAPKRSAPAPSVAQEQDPRQRAESAAIESATAWLDRIIRLRRDGRHSEADAELKLFRERYPQVRPPSEALPPTPTR